MATKGFIKYRCEWIKADAVSPKSIEDLSRYRNALFQLGFIREDADGTGVGNISIRTSQHSLKQNSSKRRAQFIISGSQTGKLPTVTEADYSLVTDFNAEQNSVVCKGMRKASSESLTHGVIYSSAPEINAVIHIHDSQIWKELLEQAPATNAEVAYGTPEMANETQRLFEESELLKTKIFAMAGHEDGIVSFGESLQAAYQVLINWALRVNLLDPTEAKTALALPSSF